MILPDAIRMWGVAATHELLAAGWTSRQLSRAVALGEIVRVRQGWYCEPQLLAGIQGAIRVGGRLTCVSAGRMLGLAVQDSAVLHVAVPRHASRLRRSDDHQHRLEHASDVVVHWNDSHVNDRMMRPVEDVLNDLVRCQPLEFAVAAIDSAIRLNLISLHRCLQIFASAIVLELDSRSESICESVCKVRLHLAGIDVELQVWFAGIGRVDMLIGRRLVIEVDGREFHAREDSFERDRARDAALSIRGYRVLRFSYRQVMYDWPHVLAAVEAAIARGDHL